MEALAKRREGVYLRIVDVVSWSSPVAQQHQVRSLPTIWIYEDGKLWSKDRGEVIEKLNSLER